MAIKIGINGFGRIGRVVLRILAEDPEQYEICGINLRKADVDYMVYLLKYDSVFRNFNGTKRPPFCTFFLRLARKRSGTRQTNPLFSNFLMRNSAYRDH